ncbi:MAG: CoA transferase subunit B [Tindallia sp. MSAO_Bac2]|nr:MAG: CoA transferase subunit B [Tindallia sp. MSAO_Bac2]
MNVREKIAKRVAQMLQNGDVVNLGIGLPTLVANYIPENIEVTLQSENGFVGMGPDPLNGQTDLDTVNASGLPATIMTGGSYFDSATSFGMIRGGHVDATILGAHQVDQEGNLANWKLPGKPVYGMGGAMDLVAGAKRVIIAMEHTVKGEPKIKQKCTYPLTAKRAVNTIVTDKCIFEITPGGMVLIELASGVTVDDVREITEADFFLHKDLKNGQE